MVETTFEGISYDCQSRYGLWYKYLEGYNLSAMSIYCHKQFNEKVSIKRIRELRTTILNELYAGHHPETNQENFKGKESYMQKPNRTTLDITLTIWN